MKRFLTFALLILCLASCKQLVDKEAVSAAVSSQLESHPESLLQDLYKSFFQDRFGPDHMIVDRDYTMEMLAKELQAAQEFSGPKLEPCGWEGNYVRVNLSVITDGEMTAEEMTDALMASSKPVRKRDFRRWKREWKRIVSIIETEHPELPGLPEHKEMIKDMLASGQYACHHTALYEATYHPHYRIIARDQIEKYHLDK